LIAFEKHVLLVPTLRHKHSIYLDSAWQGTDAACFKQLPDVQAWLDTYLLAIHNDFHTAE
jgi:hypothetical protein